MSTYFLFFAYLILVVGTAVAVVLIFARLRLLARGRISRSLNLELLLVRFLHYPAENQQSLQQIREKISLMEQLYQNLSVLKDIWWRNFLYGRPLFALELTVPHTGEEISFYVAVPRRFVPAVEKIIQGIFPDAHVEKSRDYNIFNPNGAVAASWAVLKTNRFYPLKTYQKLEGDPLREITNVFTKLAREGEGAAIQIVARPASKKWARKLKDEAKILFGTKKAKADIVISAVGALGELAPTAGSSETRERPEEPKKITPMQEELVRSLEGKAGKSLFETNIRLVASAPEVARASAILQGLEVALAQFNDPSLNSFKIIRAEGRSLKNLVFNFSFRIFDEKRTAILGSDELTSIFHFPNVPIETPLLKTLKARESAPPSNLPMEGLLLGQSVFRGEDKKIKILDDDRRRHMYVIGQTGTGKSVFLENMIVQDLAAGKGLCVIDPHGELVERMLEFVPRHRLQDVVYFNPGDLERPLAVNMLEYDPAFPEQKTIIVNELFSIFEKLFNMSIAGGPLFEQYFRNATMLVMDDPSSGNTILEIERVLADKEFRDLKLSRCKNVVVKNFWTQIAEKAGGEASLKDMVPYVASKIDNFIANEIMRPIVAQEKSSINFREIMDSGKILLVNLSKGRLGELSSSFIGLILVGKLLMAALSRTGMDQEKRRDFYLYIDEFQNVTTDSIATILSEARKYRLDLIITHQFIGQLKEEIKKAVFGNVGSMVSFRIGSDDAEFMSKQFKPVFTEQDLLNIDNHNCYVKLLINGQTSNPFNMKTYPPSTGSKEMAVLAKEISRTKYGRPREEVEQEILQKHQRQNPDFMPASPLGEKL